MDILRRLYKEVNKWTNGILGLLVIAIRRYGRSGASEAAASLAYYAFFSLFPFLLVLISVGSFALERAEIAELVFDLLSGVLPSSAEFIQSSIQQVLDQRGPVGLVGLLGLLWSASGAFSGLVKHINLAWPGTNRRGMFHRRFVGLSLVIVLLVLFVAWLGSNLILEVLPRFIRPEIMPEAWMETRIWSIVTGIVPFMFTFLLFYGLYRWIPNREVPWKVALWGALVAAVGSDLATNLFSWYLSSGFAGYSLVYGSLGAIVAFMFWVYLLSQIALFGAHLSAAIGYGARRMQS